MLVIRQLCKAYPGGHQALQSVSLDIQRGEIFALLGPNGAGKTTLIGIACGLVNPSSGSVHVDGHDVVRDFRAARATIGLVPQELTTEAFETVWAAVCFSRGLFGCTPDPAHIEQILRSLSLWDKRNSRISTLSGGMKRRVLIAKALSHNPRVLFLDEPSAGVDVELRRDMWSVVRSLRDQGVTIILTTHYIEEAEQMADRIGILNKGQLVLVENKDTLIRRLGRRELTLTLQQPLATLPPGLDATDLSLSEDGLTLRCSFQHESGQMPPITQLLRQLEAAGCNVRDLHTQQSSLEEIFVQLVSSPT